MNGGSSRILFEFSHGCLGLGARGAPFGSHGKAVLALLQEGVVVCVLGAGAHMRFYGRVCGVVKARATSDPLVAGSIPAGGESCCSSVVERWATA